MSQGEVAGTSGSSSAGHREMLVKSPRTVFRNDSQRADLLDPYKTQDALIALLCGLALERGYFILFTAIRTDHGDDSGLGYHCHAHGFCADVWPLHSENATDYVDASEPLFQQFLRDAARSAYIHQIGLAGSAYTVGNIAACAGRAFQDDGGDHVHLGAQ